MSPINASYCKCGECSLCDLYNIKKDVHELMAVQKIMNSKSFADQCLERASLATEGPWRSVSDGLRIKNVIASDQTIIRSGFPANSDFVAHAREDVPILALRLKEAIHYLRTSSTVSESIIEALEAPLENE